MKMKTKRLIHVNVSGTEETFSDAPHPFGGGASIFLLQTSRSRYLIKSSYISSRLLYLTRSLILNPQSHQFQIPELKETTLKRLRNLAVKDLHELQNQA